MNGTLFPAWMHGAVCLVLAYYAVQLGRGHLVFPLEIQRRLLEMLPILKSGKVCYGFAALFAVLGGLYLASHLGLRL
ncbi:hypothetical protein [Paucibacter sp. XJ19-41]|uniref:hypothetical protein n=1 Tax=Paucibacter sp. XJ19-41 TaxID=2927824 RepID=UPI00234A8904|nr:hypothetical protein [Paucibacter sp. XJ19-41]MDC6169076.1 hypothetical protein [Paucibacter sp. XJ19-41]